MVFWVSLILHILRIDIIDYLNYNIDIFKSCVLLPVFGKWHGVPLFMSFSGVNHIAVIPLARAVFCVRRRQRQELVCQMHTVDWGDWVHTPLQMLSPANALIRLFSVALGHSSRWTIINRGWCFSFWEVIFLGECSVPVVWQSPQILQCSEGLHWRAHPVASHWAAAVHLERVTLSNSQVTLIPQVFNKKAALPRQCKPGKKSLLGALVQLKDLEGSAGSLRSAFEWFPAQVYCAARPLWPSRGSWEVQRAGGNSSPLAQNPAELPRRCLQVHFPSGKAWLWLPTTGGFHPAAAGTAPGTLRSLGTFVVSMAINVYQGRADLWFEQHLGEVHLGSEIEMSFEVLKCQTSCKCC